MKKIAIILFTIIIYCSIPLINPTKAETNLEPLKISEINKLIDEKMKEEKPLTNDELNKALIELKDEKIDNLEGNLSKIINTAALFVGAVALVLTIIVAVIGWAFNNSISTKLTKILEVEKSINTAKGDIESRKKEIDGIYEKINNYAKILEKTNNSLAESSNLLDQKSSQIDDLFDRLVTVEDITDSSIIINQFLISRNQAIKTVHETRQILKKPQKNLEHVLLKLRRNMGLMNEFDDFEGFLKHFEYLCSCLLEQESAFWEKVMCLEKIEEAYISYDAETTMTWYEDFNDNYDNWKDYLDDIKTIKKTWEANL